MRLIAASGIALLAWHLTFATKRTLLQLNTVALGVNPLYASHELGAYSGMLTRNICLVRFDVVFLSIEASVARNRASVQSRATSRYLHHLLNI